MTRSKKRSGRRNFSAPRSDIVLFVDRSLGRRIVPDALRAAGYPVITHDEKFPPDTPDEDWLAVAGAQGWVVLSRDLRIRRKPNELGALRGANVKAFFVTGGNLTGDALAALLLKLGRRIQDTALGAASPAAFIVSRHGRIMKLKI